MVTFLLRHSSKRKKSYIWGRFDFKMFQRKFGSLRHSRVKKIRQRILQWNISSPLSNTRLAPTVTLYHASREWLIQFSALKNSSPFICLHWHSARRGFFYRPSTVFLTYFKMPERMFSGLRKTNIKVHNYFQKIVRS